MPRVHAAEPNWPGPEEPVPQPPQPELPPKKPSEPELPSPDPGRSPFPGPGPTDPGVPPPVSYQAELARLATKNKTARQIGGSVCP
ncbi:MAG TPA: hypothetical protein VN974_12085 [Candidatus Dormibacteraeota bacterium]|nr:hypothetical protein [Candidatus Dormibacteraeota bacterium]